MPMRPIKFILLIFCFLLQSCVKEEDTPDLGPSDLTILYTNDEHGWISETDDTDGAAKLMGVWRDVEGYTENSSFLILSGGDNWTGPAISTWFQGESTVETMNAMGYSAAAIGNHEFDFQVAGLQERVAQANFPYLSANIRLKSNDSIPDFAEPYVVIEVNDILVGIIGLTTQSASYTTFPTYVEDFNFIAYNQALQEYVPQIWAEGVEVILCVAHICKNEMMGLVLQAKDLGISMIGGGHFMCWSAKYVGLARLLSLREAQGWTTMPDWISGITGRPWLYLTWRLQPLIIRAAPPIQWLKAL